MATTPGLTSRSALRIGINGHYSIDEPPYSPDDTVDPAMIAYEAALAVVGHRERAFPDSSLWLSAASQLYDAGIPMLCTLGNGSQLGDIRQSDINDLVSELADVYNDGGVLIYGIEGPNEGNAAERPEDWATALCTIQQWISEAIGTYFTGDFVPLRIGPALRVTDDYLDDVTELAGTGISSFVDKRNVHYYPASLGPYAYAAELLAVYDACVAAGTEGEAYALKPVVMSESGWSDYYQSQAITAPFYRELACRSHILGVPIFGYELGNEAWKGTEDPESQFGIVYDGSETKETYDELVTWYDGADETNVPPFTAADSTDGAHASDAYCIVRAITGQWNVNYLKNTTSTGRLNVLKAYDIPGRTPSGSSSTRDHYDFDFDTDEVTMYDLVVVPVPDQ